ncbi:unnamed protein product [Rotaria socialis]|uniref:Rab GTPase n=1 Tax=Rotaria socialis TaxID=392032 RepID=A0A821SES1_9BILA|nr:unnamed protein product [Rotaria socialis]
MTATENDQHFKILLIGDSDVGKASLITRFTNDTFNESLKPAIDVEFTTKLIVIDEEPLRLQIWDSSGQEQHHIVSNVQGIIMVFDVTKAESFENTKLWLQVIDQHSGENEKKLLIGNKCDLTYDRVVGHETAKKFADSLSMPYLETSAKRSINVEQAFTILAAELMSIPKIEASCMSYQLTTEPTASTTLTKSECDYLLRLLIVGDSGVGKSSLLLRLADDTFTDSFPSTSSVDFRSRTMELNEKRLNYKL